MNSESILAGKIVGGSASARLTIDGRQYINFFGSGYLALSGVADLRSAAMRTLQLGAPFAQHVPASLGGIDPTFAEIERAAAVACGTAATVYFASGYFIGMVGLASIDPSPDLVFLDETAHYSLQDAATLSQRPTFTFPHCDVEALRALLRKHIRPKQRPIVLTDGVFPTTGRIAPLSEYAAALAPYEGRLFVDDSHGFGVVGNCGRGSAEHCGVEHLTTTGATLSKAFCAQGAFVGCTSELAMRLRTIPSIRGACAGSPLSAAAATASLAYVAEHPELREGLREITQYFRTRLRSIGLEVSDSPAPIVSFRWRGRADMLALQRRVFDRGIYIHHSTYIGAGPEGVIRCAVFRDHSREDIDALVSALG
jgi:7-keto-8-aminopelargonate synthetase-like enzyme